jgi:nucleoside-triphosphatase THEP1
MKKIKNLKVKVTYTVGVGDFEAPENVVEQLKKAMDKSKGISMDEYGYFEEASQWLQQNIRERDSMEWSVEVEECD